MMNQLNDTYRGDQDFQYQGEELLDVVCLVPPSLQDAEADYVYSVHSNYLNISFRSSDYFQNIIKNTPALNVGNDRYLTEHCNIRIFLGSLLPDYDRVIYIDPDTWIERSIWPLVRMPMRNKFMAWVETSNMNDVVFRDWDRPYFNNGVFIADLNFWREQNMESKMIAWMDSYLKQWGRLPICPEQDAMNAVFIDYLAPLHISANLFNYLSDSPNLSWGNPVEYIPIIVHFVGEEKPWLVPDTTEWAKKWNHTFERLWDFEYQGVLK